MKRKKILFAAQNMYIGGVQTSLVNLLYNIKDNDEYDIDMFIFGDGPLMEQIPANVKVTQGNMLLRLSATPFAEVIKSRKLPDIILRIFLIIYVRIKGSEAFYTKMLEKHKCSEKYDSAISYFTDVPDSYFNKGTNLYVSDYVKADEKLAWIHNDPILGEFNKEHCEKIYKSFDRIVCVSGAVKSKFDEWLPQYKNKTEVIYNTFKTEEIIEKAKCYTPDFDRNKVNIVTVSRIDNKQKRIDDMVRLCRRFKDEGITNFCWRMIGAGPDMTPDSELAKELEVLDVVSFEGEKINPYPYIKNSDLFALYSAYEGYPMVIGETLILGVPILSKEYAAAFEQIPHDKGYIAKSDEEFYLKLKEYILKAKKEK